MCHVHPLEKSFMLDCFMPYKCFVHSQNVYLNPENDITTLETQTQKRLG